MKQLFLRNLILVTALLVPASGATAREVDRRPNIVVILADDLGYGDLGCYGHPRIQSPVIDQLAAEGMRLTSCYSAASNCSPSRTGLMTGRFPQRVGIHNWIPMFAPMHVRRSEVTVSTLLRDSGYQTCHVGKWHLNGQFNLPTQPQPSDHGFDYWFSTQNNALPTHHNPRNFVRNGIPLGPQRGYSAGLVADEAIRWLRGRDPTSPFFLYVCFHEPHEPINSAPRYRALYDAPADSTLPNHHGNVTQMDAALGRLLGTLDRFGLRENTLLIFTSDNGPAITRRHPHGSAGPLRDKKGYVSEGGIRVPGIIRWPGHTRPGETCDEPVCGVDLLPTLCTIAGVDIPADRTIDGTSFLPVFAGEKIERSTPLYWHFNFAQGPSKVAMRDGEWKIMATLTGPRLPPTGHVKEADQVAIKNAQLSKFKLYHLGRDIGEKKDLAASEPAQLEKMVARLQVLYQDVREESPSWPDWTFAGHEGKIINAYYKQQELLEQRRQGKDRPKR
jgi:arylsulfatase A